MTKQLTQAEYEKLIAEQEFEALTAFQEGKAGAPVLYRVMGFVLKTQASETEADMTFVASEESPDRMGDIVRVEGWDVKEFKKNPVFLWSHNPMIPPIGRVSKVWTEGKQLLSTVQFDSDDPLAQAVMGKMQRGFLKAVSVGFRPIEMERIKNDGKDEDAWRPAFEFKKQELLEISAVAIPAHPHALRKSLPFALLVPDLSQLVGGTKEMNGAMKGKMRGMSKKMRTIADEMDDMAGEMGGDDEKDDITPPAAKVVPAGLSDSDAAEIRKALATFTA